MEEFDRGLLGFSSAAEMNDDFDGLLYFDKKQIKQNVEQTVTPQNINMLCRTVQQGAIPAEIQKRIPKEALQAIAGNLLKLTPENLQVLRNQFLDFVTDDYDRRMSFISTVTQCQKVACLSTDINSTSMWGHYADSGKGFALAYDLRKPDCIEYSLAPVIYGGKRLEATQYATWIFQQETIKRALALKNMNGLYTQFRHAFPCPDEFMALKILIHKATDWRPEKEWRLVYYEKENQNEKHPHIPKRPTAVYLGRNISDSHREALCRIAEKSHIPVYRMTLCEDAPTYKLRPIRMENLS